MSEAEYLESQWDGCDDVLEINVIALDATNYNKAKSAKVGQRVMCGGNCGKSFIKTSYQQAFCCNRGRGNCKDNYHNRTANRAFNTELYIRNKIK